MKTFIQVVGILALLGGVLAFFAAPTSIQEILGALGVLIAIVAFGFGTLIERADLHLERTSKHRLMERDHWDHVLTAMRSPKPLPPVPGQEKYFVALGDQVNGPHDRAAVGALLLKKAVTRETPLLREGADKWGTVADLQ